MYLERTLYKMKYLTTKKPYIYEINSFGPSLRVYVSTYMKKLTEKN